MSERIAEFQTLGDAQAFRNLKGKDDFDVVGGIRMNYAVMPKQRYALDCGNSEPADVGPAKPYNDPDEDTL